MKQLSNGEMQLKLTGRKCLMVLNQIRGGSTKSLHVFQTLETNGQERNVSKNRSGAGS